MPYPERDSVSNQPAHDLQCGRRLRAGWAYKPRCHCIQTWGCGWRHRAASKKGDGCGPRNRGIPWALGWQCCQEGWTATAGTCSLSCKQGAWHNSSAVVSRDLFTIRCMGKHFFPSRLRDGRWENLVKILLSSAGDVYISPFLKLVPVLQLLLLISHCHLRQIKNNCD